MPDVPLLFAVITQDYMRRPATEQSASQSLGVIYDQLYKLNYLNDVNDTQLPNSPHPQSISPHDNPEFNPDLSFNFVPVDTLVTNFLDFTPELLGFVQCNMKQQVTSAASSLHDAHARCLQTLILYAHDLARDVLVTPKRIKYARTKEEELYTQLIDLASRKQSEIKELVYQAIADATDNIVQQVIQLHFEEIGLDASLQAPDTKTAKKCVQQLQDLVFRELSRQISERLVNSVNYLRESVVGTLKRCLERLEEKASGEDGGETSKALSQILDTAYNLEFSERTSTSAVRIFVERIKQAFQGPTLKNTKLDRGWREKYARQLIASLSGSRLAKSICAQFRGRVTSSHETFLSAIKQLELRHSGRLKETEGQRDTLRKVRKWFLCQYFLHTTCILFAYFLDISCIPLAYFCVLQCMRETCLLVLIHLPSHTHTHTHTHTGADSQDGQTKFDQCGTQRRYRPWTADHRYSFTKLHSSRAFYQLY